MPLKKSVTKKPAPVAKASPQPKTQASSSKKNDFADRAIANLKRVAKPTDRIDDYIDP